MRTNIEIDDALMADAMKWSGLATKRDVVEEALRTLVQMRRQADVRNFRGKFQWEGDLDAMRTSRLLPEE